jgi:type IV secretion system protein VirB10
MLFLVFAIGAVVMLIFVGIFTPRSPSGNSAQGGRNEKVTGAAQSGQEMARKLEAKKREDLAATGGMVGPDGTPTLTSATHGGLAVGEEQPPLVAKAGTPTLTPGPTYNNPAPGPGLAATPQKTAEQKEREELYKLEQQARMAGTAAGGRGNIAQSGPTTLADTLTGLVNRYASSVNPGTPQGPSVSGNSDDQNGQNQKEAFFNKGQSVASYLKYTRTPQLTKFEIKAGWDIPAILEQAINTDLPGEIKALVRENVYDTATGRYLLIPQGSRLLGTYNSHVTYGQSRVQVIWTRLVYPDGSSVSLDTMLGQDAQGAGGFHHKTNNHYVRLAGMALLTSAFSAGVSMATNQQSTSPYGAQTNSQIATQAIAQQMGELGIEVTRKNMQIQPTIKIPIGYRFNVRVNKDIAFAEPYAHAGRYATAGR